MLVLIVKDIFLVSPGPSQICEGKCILLSVLMHPAVGPPGTLWGKSTLLAIPPADQVSGPDEFSVQTKQAPRISPVLWTLVQGRSRRLFPWYLWRRLGF